MKDSQQEEIKDASPLHEDQEERVYKENFIERPFQVGVKVSYQRVLEKITLKKTNSNNFGSALRLFKVHPSLILGFPSMEYLRNTFSRALQALYIFKLHHPHKEGYTHGLQIRLNGFVHRKILERLIEEFITAFTTQQLDMKAYVPIINKQVSLYDYLESLYVLPKNLYVNFSHYRDAISDNQRFKRPDNRHNAELKTKMQAMTTQILDTMVSMPSKYPNSYVLCILSLTVPEYRKRMRSTTLRDIVTHIAQDAYSYALQDKRFKIGEIQELMEPMTRRAMLNRCVGDKITKHVQMLLQQTYGNLFVHPHPYSSIVSSSLSHLRPLDGIIFDPRFLFSMMLISRWFLKSCMLEESQTSNNHAHLLLYGGAGTGKSLMISVISAAIPTYKFIVNSRFQNPDMLQSSALSIEEFEVGQLPSNQYKSLLDLKTHVKIDFKNLNPENVSEGVPCMITTNDEVLNVLRVQKKYNQQSVAAALRRLYIVPMKAGPFEKLHGRVSSESPSYENVAIFDGKFDKEHDKLERMFNVILALALFQGDVGGLYFDDRLHGYFGKLAKDFSCTIFGTFYLSQKAKIDELIKDVESSMTEDDQDDSSYLVKVSTCVGQFQQLLYTFIAQMVDKGTELKMSVIKDKTVPWPLKGYYLLSSYKLSVKLMWEVDKYEESLNPEVRSFLLNPRSQMYMPEPVQIYEDLREPFDSSDEAKGVHSFGTPKQEEMPLFDDLDIESMIEGCKRTVSQRMDLDDIVSFDDMFKLDDQHQ